MEMMDRILFYLSNQLEALQIQTQIFAQQGQQWIVALIAQIQEFLKAVRVGQNAQYLQNILEGLLMAIEKGWEQILDQYYAIQLNATGIYYRVMNFCGSEVPRRETIFCLGGLTIGLLFGYYIGVNSSPYFHHLHRIKAIVCPHYTGTKGASLVDDVEMPAIRKPNELLIKVKAASVNVVDTKICSGYSNVYRKLLNSGKNKNVPVILGRECSGLVTDIGYSVMNFDIGDGVFLAVPSWAPGTMAEYIVVPESQVVKRPKNWGFEASASLPYNGCLAWDALVNKSVIEEGNARGKRVLIYGGVTPVGCILTQLVKLWSGYVLTICPESAISLSKALGADDTITLGESDIEKELELHDKFDAIFNTGGTPIDERILQMHLVRYGSYVSTVPEPLFSDSMGYISRSIFSGCMRLALLIQYIFGYNSYHWKDGSKIHSSYLQTLCDLADAHQLQSVVDRVYGPHNIEQALNHVLDREAIGSTIVTFQ